MCVGQILGLDLLGVIGGQTCKDQNTDGRNREHQRRRGEEDVNDRRDNQTDHAHDQKAAPAGDVLLGGVAPKRQTGKGDRRDQKDLRDGIAGEDQKDRADRDAHDGSKGVEHDLRRGRRHFVDHCAKAKDKSERREHYDPFQRRGIERIAQLRQVLILAKLRHGGRGVGGNRQPGDGPGRGEGDEHADRHGAIHLVHMSAQTLVDRGDARPGSRAN